MKPSLVVVSHACVIDENQAIYAAMQDEFDVTLIVPRRWRDELRPRRYAPGRLAAFTGTILRVPTVLQGRPQRHRALVLATRRLRRLKADFVIVEEEPFSVAAAHWTAAARRADIPYAVQAAENLPRRLPWLAKISTTGVLEGSSFLLARSPAALAQARTWGYRGPDSVLPHGVRSVITTTSVRPSGVVGFVGRLVAAKGVGDLVAALRERPALDVRVAGDGPLRGAFKELGDRAHLLGAVPAGEMDPFYDALSVLAVPSRTTPTWSEQFGRVIIEAQARGVPVVAFASGEIPWVAEQTAALVVPEGDVEAFGEALESLALHPQSAAALGERGRSAVATTFLDDVLARRLTEWVHSATAT